MTPGDLPPFRSGNQKGHLMAGLMAGFAIMAIFSTMAFQAWDEVKRRDDEAEMIFRAQEIVRAIVRYRRDQRISPEKLEDLMEAGSKAQYFLRRLYDDPLVKGGKWGLLYEGPGGQIIDPSNPNAMPGQIPGLEGLGGQASSRPGQEPKRLAGEKDKDDGKDRDQDRNRSNFGSLSSNQQGEQTGMRIAGVKSLCDKQPFRVYKGFEEYSEWLFTYLDLEQQQVPGQGRPGGAGGQPGRSGNQGGLNNQRQGGDNGTGPTRKRGN